MLKRSIATVAAAVFSCGVSFGSWGQGQDASDTDSTLSSKAPDVRVVIDISGSMKQNDPKNLRKPALELLVQSLPQDGRSGVWTFGQYVNMMVPHKPITERWRGQALEKAANINSVGLFTNIGSAMEKSAYDLHYDNNNRAFDTHMILLTDGMVDIDRDPSVNLDERRRIIDSVLPKLKGADYTIHTIALSDNADQELMRRLAQGTDGVFEVAQSADDLMKIFMRVLNQAAPAEEVPLNNNRFLVDSSVEEFTALVFKTPDAVPTQLKSPDGAQYSFDKEREDVNWYRTESYDLITVKRPLEGEWQLLADVDPDNRVAIISNLQLRAKPLKNNVEPDKQQLLSLALLEGGRPISNTELLQLVDVEVELTRDQTGERVFSAVGSFNDEALYTKMLYGMTEEGNYQLDVSVDGKSFQRRFKHRFAVVRPFGVSLKKDERSALPRWVLTVSGYTDNLDLAQTNVLANVRSPDGISSIKPLSRTPMDNWELVIEPEVEGEYTLDVRVTSVTNGGDSAQMSLPSQRFSYPDGFDPFASVAPVEEPVVVEPEEPKEEPKEEHQPEEPKEEGSNMVLYLGLGIGNLIILVLGFIAYRMITKDESNEEEFLEEEVEAKSEGDAPPAELAMAQIDTSLGDLDDDDESIDEALEDDIDSALNDLDEFALDDEDDEFALDDESSEESNTTDNATDVPEDKAEQEAPPAMEADSEEVDIDSVLDDVAESMEADGETAVAPEDDSSSLADEILDESILDDDNDDFSLDDDFDGDDDLSEFSLDDFDDDLDSGEGDK